MSSCTIVGSMITNLLWNVRKPHPVVSSRTCIDWDVVILFQPLTLVGAVSGTYVNQVMPAVQVHIGLTILLSILSVISVRRVCLVSSESQLTKAQVEVEPSTGKAQETKLDSADWGGGGVIDQADVPTAQFQQHSITRPVLTAAGFFVCVLLLNLLKGSDKGVNILDLDCGSTEYWCLSLAAIPIAIGISVCARSRLLDSPTKGDIEWSSGSSAVLMTMSFCIGLLAGLFGIGGAIMLGPMMLEMGLIPQVAQATSSTSNLFSSAAAAISYIIFGVLDDEWETALGLFFLGLAGTTAGRLLFEKCAVLGWAPKDHAIVGVIALIVLISTVIIFVETIDEIVSDGMDDESEGLC